MVNKHWALEFTWNPTDGNRRDEVRAHLLLLAEVLIFNGKLCAFACVDDGLGLRAFAVLSSGRQRESWFRKNFKTSKFQAGSWSESEVAPPETGNKNAQEDRLQKWRSRFRDDPNYPNYKERPRPPSAEETPQPLSSASPEANDLVRELGQFGPLSDILTQLR